MPSYYLSYEPIPQSAYAKGDIAVAFWEIVSQRHNAKKFNGKKINNEKITELFDIIRMAPSADNLQPWKIKVISDRNTLDKLTPATPPFNQEKMRTCSHLLVFCADQDLEMRWSRVESAARQAGLPGREITHMAGVANMILNRSPEERLNRSQRDVFLAAGNAINGASSLGFDSSIIGSFNPKEFTRILKLPRTLEPTLIIAIGYAADTPPQKLRFSKEDVFF